MRILQVMESTLGGTRRYLENMFEVLGGGEDNALAYSLDRADAGFLALLEKLRAAGWTLFEVDMRRPIQPANEASCALALRRIYHAYRPDVVHAHSSKAGALSRIATLGMRRRPRIVYAPHSIASNVSRVYGLIERALSGRFDVMTAVTSSERVELLGLELANHDRVHVVVPTIDPEAFAPRDRDATRAQLSMGAGPLVLGVGRLTRQKDPLAFVEIARILADRLPGVRALWVGDGELRPAMEQRIAELGLDACVSVTGWLTDVRPYMAAADVVVSTSRYESFGYVAAEALAMARPVVASKVTGTVDVLAPSLGGELYAVNDVGGAAERVERLLRHPWYAEHVARRGRAHVHAAFSRHQMRHGLNAAYAAATGGLIPEQTPLPALRTEQAEAV